MATKPRFFRVCLDLNSTRYAALSDARSAILAFDSALGGCIAAVLDPALGKTASRVLETDRAQASKLMPMVQEVMEEAGISFGDVSFIVTTNGPGSFTGLRIGLSAARAMALALSVPLQGVSTFAAMQASCDPKAPSLVVLESKRKDYYVQAFDGAGGMEGEPFCAEIEEIIEKAKGRIVCSDAGARLKAEGAGAFASLIDRQLYDPLILLKLGEKAFQAAGGAAGPVEPFYMRGADVSVSKKVQREITGFPLQ
ncbi:MAG: tRNA (adenosine(37)-N6)-threonylcarbamoyltransferase complex dimerization subunit type 1 TsaB [Micavibrio aeruginosavorus]|uniref:tRNA (Adenosine(37)-N6)-threonylcarbamoyltransferase complex dimerization subunit type 1 TsaB n=1 Tax=Micavibrio aeruginosavorus TaxID=349221 RepID=A0A2W5N428_9BACT|nr:MAG: tRNA (adenosine(37)-N6)-threonylcarbamoyltransferase complex dimerization subunit type 1 TsaB [Micavibrio aeruginosavorus]